MTVNDVFFTSPLIQHYFDNVGTGSVRYAEITFEFVTRSGTPLNATFDALLSSWTNQPCRPLLRARASKVFARSFLTAIEALVSRQNRARPMDDLEVNATLWSVLSASYESMFRRPTIPPDDPGHDLDGVRDHLRVHYREDMSLEKLARMAGMTPNYFSRRFKQFYGRTPIDYQLDLRMRHACALLRTADRKLSNIASAVGFSDVYYFSRLFKRRIGISPGQYRQAQLDSAKSG